MKVHYGAVALCAVFLCTCCSAQIIDKLNFSAGAGFTDFTGRAGRNLNTGWNLDFRGGYNVSHYLAADLDFAYSHADLNNAALARYGEPGGSAGFWSLTFNPVLKLAPRHSRVQPYATAGYGLYHRNLSLTRPALVSTLFCDPFFGFCYPATVGVNQVVASSSTLKSGFNAGGGVDFRVASRMKVFAEARYHEMFTTHGSNYTYVPVTFGVRW